MADGSNPDYTCVCGIYSQWFMVQLPDYTCVCGICSLWFLVQIQIIAMFVGFVSSGRGDPWPYVPGVTRTESKRLECMHLVIHI